MATTLKVVQLNTAPPYEITCDRDDGTLINLTNCTVTLKLYLGSTQTNSATGHDACTITDAAGGIVTWQPQTGDLPSPGLYKGDVKITYIDSTFEVLYGNLKITARKLLG
jgi:hypothetical protein